MHREEQQTPNNVQRDTQQTRRLTQDMVLLHRLDLHHQDWKGPRNDDCRCKAVICNFVRVVLHRSKFHCNHKWLFREYVFGVLPHSWLVDHTNLVGLFNLFNCDVDSGENVVVLVHVLLNVDEADDIFDADATDLIIISVKRLMLNHTVIFGDDSECYVHFGVPVIALVENWPTHDGIQIDYWGVLVVVLFLSVLLG